MREREISSVVTRGRSEIYDLLTHLTFLHVEAKKIYRRTGDELGNTTAEWNELEAYLDREAESRGLPLDQAIWHLSVILGRTYSETRETYDYFETTGHEGNDKRNFFDIIYKLGKLGEESLAKDHRLIVHLAVALSSSLLGNHIYGRKWAEAIRDELSALGLQDRPFHVISSNLHSAMNLLYGYAAVGPGKHGRYGENVYSFIQRIRNEEDHVRDFARNHGFHEIPDASGTMADCQVVDSSMLTTLDHHPAMRFNTWMMREEKPVILVMDHAFGIQGYELMVELLKSLHWGESSKRSGVRSVSVMGKAGTLVGNRGDIILPSAHTLCGAPVSFFVDNDLTCEDFDESATVYSGPVLTALGTSLQNRDVLEGFRTSDWKGVGVEMEGFHYHNAIHVAVIKGHVSRDVRVRYAYYASDNPLVEGQTLAAARTGEELFQPTYMVTKAILHKILGL